MSLINHYGDSLDYGHYVSDVFDTYTRIWWHYDDDNITQINDLPEGFYSTESHKKKGVLGSKILLFVSALQRKRQGWLPFLI